MAASANNPGAAALLFGAEASGPSGAQLAFSCRVDPQRGLLLRAEIKNGGAGGVLVLDRLWTLTTTGQIIADPHGIYRLERDNTLRLVLGAAPLPRNKSALYRNVPYATLVPAGAAIEREIALAAPIAEYNPYYEYAGDKPYEPRTVQRVFLVVQVIPAAPDLRTSPSSIDPTALVIASPIEALTRAETLVCEASCAGVEVLRRTDDFERGALPGEAPEPFKPLTPPSPPSAPPAPPP